MIICVLCGAALIPGLNWYTNKGDHICCDCSGWPNYIAPAIEGGFGYGDNDYEEAILARQENFFDD